MDTAAQFKEYILPMVGKIAQPVVIEKAKGCTCTDINGRKYLDCFAGIAVVNAGHSHPKILEAAKKQMEKLVHCCSCVYMAPPVGELAEKLAQITPGSLKRSFLANSGAEALEGAMRLAKQHTGKRELAALTLSFHGRSIGTLSITGNSIRKHNNGPYLSGVSFSPAPYCYRCPFKLSYPECGCACAQALEEVILRQTSDDVAAFIAEPVMGEGGILVPPPEFFAITSKIIQDRGGLFVADEVQSGFGRCGSMFAIEDYTDTDVDIITLAKGIASGFPVSAFVSKEEIAHAMKPGDHLTTFGGNPVSCAAAVANIQVLAEEKLIENAAARGRQIMDRVQELAETYPLIGDVRGKGLMIGIELVKDRKTKEPADQQAADIRAGLLEQGILVGKGGVFANVIRFQPPLCITEEECSRALDVFEKMLAEVKR